MAAWSSYERGNLCVSLAMSHFLVDEWGIEASVVYDRPPSHFGILLTCLRCDGKKA
jgi:hypothetical protein